MIMNNYRQWSMTVAVAIMVTLQLYTPAYAGRTLVFAAASMTDVMTTMATAFEKKEGEKITLSFAASSVLARQIEQGAPVDLFISANSEWMDHLVRQKVIAPDTRVAIASNRLALIVPVSATLPKGDSLSASWFAAIIGNRRLAIADPQAVPVGKYGKAALESLGLWEGVANKIAMMKDVRATLFMVERGEAPVGIVYTTDVALSDKVTVAALFPESTHPAIWYPAALTERGKQNAVATRFLAFVQSPAGALILENAGFVKGE
jgi:molybdate transport system substrate-binding protein